MGTYEMALIRDIILSSKHNYFKLGREKITGQRKDTSLYFEFLIPTGQILVGAVMLGKNPYRFKRVSFSIVPFPPLTDCSWESFKDEKQWEEFLNPKTRVTKDHLLFFDIFQTISWKVWTEEGYRMCTLEEKQDFVNGMPERARRICIEDPSEDFDLWLTYAISKN